MGSQVYLPFVGVVLCVFCVCLCAFTTDGCWLMVGLAIFVFLLYICCSVCMCCILSICLQWHKGLCHCNPTQSNPVQSHFSDREPWETYFQLLLCVCLCVLIVHVCLLKCKDIQAWVIVEYNNSLCLTKLYGKTLNLHLFSAFPSYSHTFTHILTELNPQKSHNSKFQTGRKLKKKLCRCINVCDRFIFYCSNYKLLHNKGISLLWGWIYLHVFVHLNLHSCTSLSV